MDKKLWGFKSPRPLNIHPCLYMLSISSIGYLFVTENSGPVIVGTYERTPASTTEYNDAYVTYDVVGNRYMWITESGQRWSLYPTANKNELRVGEDCPYHSSGYGIAAVTNEGIRGPNGDLFRRKFNGVTN